MRLVLLSIAASIATLSSVAPARAPAAAETGRYRNIFREWRSSIDERAIDAKLDRYWRSLFEGGADERVYFAAPPTADGPAAYILDVGNDDVRSEGMSYGMMLAVQMGHKRAFDALWNWAATHMRYKDGPRAGYFRWRCTREGCPKDSVPASDGEEYIATALLMASGRWGDGRGLYDYAAQANAILDVMLHKEEMNGGVVAGVTNMVDAAHRQVVFVPQGGAAGFTDPSYHLPAFYELWARQAAGWRGRAAEDRRRWRAIAATSRTFFAKATHPKTGLSPDYAEFDGRPKAIDGHGDFRFDAFRTAANWAVDQAWWGKNPQAAVLTDRLHRFFEGQGSDYPAIYHIDGTPIGRERSTALIATNAVASLASPSAPRGEFVAALWALEPPRGRWRYYDGLIQFMATMHVAGRFKAYERATQAPR